MSRRPFARSRSSMQLNESEKLVIVRDGGVWGCWITGARSGLAMQPEPARAASPRTMGTGPGGESDGTDGHRLPPRADAAGQAAFSGSPRRMAWYRVPAVAGFTNVAGAGPIGISGARGGTAVGMDRDGLTPGEALRSSSCWRWRPTALALAAVRVVPPLHAAQALFDDWRIARHAPTPPQRGDIAVVALDEATLDDLACRSPIDRRFLAGLIERLDETGVVAIGLDRPGATLRRLPRCGTPPCIAPP